MVAAGNDQANLSRTAFYPQVCSCLLVCLGVPSQQACAAAVAPGEGGRGSGALSVWEPGRGTTWALVCHPAVLPHPCLFAAVVATDNATVRCTGLMPRRRCTPKSTTTCWWWGPQQSTMSGPPSPTTTTSWCTCRRPATGEARCASWLGAAWLRAHRGSGSRQRGQKRTKRCPRLQQHVLQHSFHPCTTSRQQAAVRTKPLCKLGAGSTQPP